MGEVLTFTSPDPDKIMLGGVLQTSGARSRLTTTASDQTESGGFVTTVSYDNLGNQISMTDGLNNTTSMQYDNLNRITQITRPDPGTGTSPQTDFDYQANYFGWKITATDASGLELVVQTDALGRTRSISGDTSTQEIRYWLDGLTKSTSEENGGLTQFDYDTRGRLLSVAAPAISGVSSTTNYAYLVDSLLDTVTDPAGRITSFSYDVGGRTKRITQPDPDGAGPLAAAYTDIVRDGLGNVLQSSDALGHATNTSYDAWFRPLTTTDPDGNVTSRGYDAFGNLLSVTDPLNNLTEYSYNKLNQLVSENKLDGTTNHLRSYSYDGVGNLRSMLDRNGRTTEFAYDDLYRATSETWKTAGTTNRTFSYSYDTSDRLTGMSDSDSLATDFQFVYDDRGQLQLERQLNGFVGTSVVFDRDYDTVGNRTKLEANFGGTLSGTSIIGGVYDFSNSYAYDAMHRLTSVTQTSRSGANAVAPKLATFSYNAASQLTDVQRYSATTPSTPTLEVHSRWGYDSAGRLTSITHGKTEITAGQTWDGSSTAPASLGTTNTLAAYFFDYDQANRLNSFSSYQDAFKTSYSYDNRDQLTAASSAAISGLTPPFTIPTAESYNLDDNGNRKSSGGASQSASGTHNRLQTDGTYNYTYDDEGNTTRRTLIATGEVTDYTWDHRNRLVSVTEKVSASGAVTQMVEFIYDAFDQRVGKRVDTDGNSTWDRYEAYVWADGHEVLRLVDSDGPGSAESFEVASRYLYADAVDQVLADEQYDGNGPVLSASTASTQAGETLWTLGDHLGSIRDVVDNNGIIRQHVVYDSFGNRVLEVDYNSSGTQIAKSHADAIDILFGYTGRDWDEDIELQYNRARWYDPATGRWLSQDPIGFAAGDANLYRYTGNQPTGRRDPSGHEWWNNDWTDWLNPASWLAAIGSPLGDRIGTGVGAAANFGSEWEMNHRLHELREQRIALELLSNNPQAMTATEAYRASTGSKFKVFGETCENLTQVGDGILAAGELTFEVVGVLEGHALLKSVASGSLRLVSRSLIRNADNVLGQVDNVLLERLSLGAEIEIPDGTQRIRKLMSDLSVASGNEVALVRLKNGNRIMTMGGPNAVRVPRNTCKVIAHTHPKGSLRLSEPDLVVLRRLGQKSTVLISPREDFGVRVSVPSIIGKKYLNE